MLRRLIQWTVRRTRADQSYTLDPALSLRDLLSEVGARAVALARAQVQLVGVRGGRFRFVESGCSIRHRRHLSIGSGSVLEHGCRLRCLSRHGIHLGERVTVGKFSLIECTSVLWHLGDGLTVGDNSAIGDYSFIGCAGGVSIGNNVLMGQRVSLHSQNHDFDDIGTPIRSQGVSDQPISIGDDCWLGAGSIILAGVRLGPGCVVAAGTVVTRSFEANSVIMGVPAELVRLRAAAERGLHSADGG
jgi:acetyltransferase-like isoleucine patch superfamily enzyme